MNESRIKSPGCYSKCLKLCSILLVGICTAPLSAETPQPAPVALPQTGVRCNNLEANDIRLLYNQEAQKLQFSHVSTSNQKAITAVKATAGEQAGQTPPAVQDFQSSMGDTPTDWIIMIDNSGSMGKRKNQRRYLDEAVDLASDLVNKLAGDDTLTAYHFAQELTPLGEKCSAKNAASRSALLTKLGNEGKKRVNTGDTALWSMILTCIREQPLATQGRRQALLILTDAEEESSSTVALTDLMTEANRRKIKVHAVVFYHTTKTSGYNELKDNVCHKTGGKLIGLNKKLNQQSKTKNIDDICTYQRGSICKFTVKLAAHHSNNPLKITCSDQTGAEIASMEFTAEAVADITQQQRPRPDNSTGADNLTNDIWDRLNTVRRQLAEIATAETATPPDYNQVDELSSGVRHALKQLAPPLFKLKAIPAADIESALNKIRTPNAETQAQKARLKAFLANTNITRENVKESDLLALAGRDKPISGEDVPAVSAMLKQMESAEPLLRTLAEAEAAQQQDAMMTAANQLQNALPPILEEAKKLKTIPPERLTPALEVWTTRLTGQQPATERLTRLKTFCNDTAITPENITEQHILTLLGRTTPLPNPAEQPKPAPVEEQQDSSSSVWVYLAVGGGIILIVVAILLVFRQKKPESQEENQNNINPYSYPTPEPEPEPNPEPEPGPEPEPEPIPAPKPEPQKLPAIVPEYTKDIPQRAVLGTLTINGATYWLLSTHITIGRSKGNNISIPHDMISLHHCDLKWIATGKWEIIDLHSKNGVYAHGRKHAVLQVTSPTTFELGPIALKLTPYPPQY